jgi:hypothetical protein
VGYKRDVSLLRRALDRRLLDIEMHHQGLVDDAITTLCEDCIKLGR